MFLKQEKPEMDDFERIFFLYSKEIIFFTDTLAKISQNIFAHSFVSEHSKHFLIF